MAKITEQVSNGGRRYRPKKVSRPSKTASTTTHNNQEVENDVKKTIQPQNTDVTSSDLHDQSNQTEVNDRQDQLEQVRDHSKQKRHSRSQRKSSRDAGKNDTDSASAFSQSAKRTGPPRYKWQPKILPSATTEPQIDTLQKEKKKRTKNKDEEEDYTAATRQQVKAESKALLSLNTDTSERLDKNSIESSSQETQSGSDDDSNALVFTTTSFSPPSEISDDQIFPHAYPLEHLGSNGNVEEIQITKYEFHPIRMSITKGAVVVWQVDAETPAMVEHHLEAAFVPHDGTNVQVKATSPTLLPSDRFAWKFPQPGVVTVLCTVYQSKCIIEVVDTESRQVRGPGKKRNNRRRKNRIKKNVANVEIGEEEVQVFHSDAHLSTHQMESEVREEILEQLPLVTQTCPSDSIMIGSVLCPVSETESCMLEEMMGDNVVSFEEEIVQRLDASVCAQKERKASFEVDESGFNAGVCYDFFKQRMDQVKQMDVQVEYPHVDVNEATGVDLQAFVQKLQG